MASIRCFWIEPQGEQWVSLRRYHLGADGEAKCAIDGNGGYHQAKMQVERVPIEFEERDWHGEKRKTIKSYKLPEAFAGDERWPVSCSCGFAFTEKDARQVFCDTIYICRETGREYSLRAVPPGAMWDAWWHADVPEWRGPDGRSIVVHTPGGEWMIDGPASNCTMKDDKVHKCWVRHGEPPNLHVDKNGHTCAAGGGSIVAGNYHGFLHHGHLTDC